MGKQISDREKQLNNQANEEIKHLIKTEMTRHQVTMPVVAQRLTDMGRPITEQGLRNAVSNGRHKTTWFWDLMRAIRKEQ